MNWASFILTSIPLLVSLYATKYREQDLDNTLVELEKDLNLPRLRVYDFIVVGGGAAGCVVASRLSHAGYSVLLLEAGGTPVPAAAVPAFQQHVSWPSSINYVFESVPQRNASRSSNGIITRRPGKMLGGSTSHHGLIYNRGNPLDFDNWANITRDPTWKYENVLDFFRRSENHVSYPNLKISGSLSQHGKGGPMNVEYEEIPSLPYWLKAGNELGFETADPNGPQKESVTPAAVNRKNGQRVSTYTGFIEPIEKSRANLKVLRYANVTEILFDKNKKAIGVAYHRHGFPQVAHALKEVILSAGAFATPLLLLKSGVGPKAVLDAAEIPQVAELPVGQNLQDHIQVSLGPIIVNDTKIFPRFWTDFEPSGVQDFFERGQGHISSYLGGSQLFAVSSVAKASGEGKWPDLHIVLYTGFFSHPVKNPHEVTIWVIMTRPKGRGYISINTAAYLNGSRDDENLAEIDYKLLEDSRDLDALIDGIKTSLQFVENTTAFQSVGAKLSETPLLACAELTFRSDEYWRCYVAQLSTTWLHVAGTARMGFGVEDKEAVVDSKLRVIGVTSLRVADASVMPCVTNANTAVPTMMIGEKVVADIIKDWEGIYPYQDFKFNETEIADTEMIVNLNATATGTGSEFEEPITIEPNVTQVSGGFDKQ